MSATLEHQDRLLASRPGSVVMAADPVSGVNMHAGGLITYRPGARFRVKHALADMLWCFDAKGRTVTFAREDLTALDSATG